MKYILIIIITVAGSINIAFSQSMGKGAVAYTDHIGDFYVNASGDLDVKFLFVGDQPEIQLKWNWLKINFVVYNRVHYNALNNQLKGDYFEIMTGDYSGEVQILEDIPTLASFQDITKRVFSGSLGTSYIFKLNLEEWSSYSLEQRAKIKADWKERISPNQIRLQSFEAKNLNNLFSAIKAIMAQKNSDTSTSDFISDLEKEFDFSDDSSSEEQDQSKRIAVIQEYSEDKETIEFETIEPQELHKSGNEAELENKPQTIEIERSPEPVYTYEDVQKVNCEENITRLRKAKFNYESHRSAAIDYERWRCKCLNGQFTRENGIKNNILSHVKRKREAYYSIKDNYNPVQVPNPVNEPDLSPLPNKCRWRYE